MNEFEVKDSLDRFHKLLDKIGVSRIGIIQGTLLGAHRDGKIIEWDYDIDFFLPEVSDNFFKDIHANLNDYGFHFRESFHNGGKHFFSFSCGGVIIDIQIGTFERDLFIIENPIVIDKYPAHLFREFDTINLYGREYLTPKPIEEYLYICYGEHWRTPKDFGTDHDNLFERVWK